MYKAISKLLQGPLWLCGPSKAGVALLYLWEQLTRLTVWSVTSPQGRCLSFRGGKVFHRPRCPNLRGVLDSSSPDADELE